MPNSTSNTPYGIINDAMVDAGYLQEGAQANSEQLATYMRRLCDIINLCQTQGLKLFLQELVNIPLQVNQVQYVLGPAGPDVVMSKPQRVLQAYVTDTSNIRRPLVCISRDEFTRLSQLVGNSGTISSYFVDKQAEQLNVNFWNAPNSTEVLNTATVLVQVEAPNPINLEADVQFPQEWRIYLRWALADDICTGQPQAIMDRCQARATAYREMLENWDVEDAATYLNMDQRFYQGSGRFV
jgi:hypothetical protein